MNSEVKIREALEKGKLLFSSNDRAENIKLIGRVMAQVAEDNHLSRYVVFLLACRAPNLLLEDVLIDPKSKQFRGVLTKDSLEAVMRIREMTIDKDDYRFIEVLRMFKHYGLRRRRRYLILSVNVVGISTVYRVNNTNLQKSLDIQSPVGYT